MRTIFIFLILLLFSIPQFVLADEGLKSVFDEWVTSGVYKTSEGSNFSVVVREQTNKCYINLENQSYIVENGSCYTRNFTLVCMEGIRQSEIFDMSLFKWLYEAKIRISKRVPEVYLEKEIAKQTLLLGETTVVNLRFGNKGVKPAYSVELADTYPTNIVEIERVEGCKLRGDTVEWSGILDAGEGFECQVYIKGITPGEAQSRVDLAYYDGFDRKNINVKEKIRVKEYQVELDSQLLGGNFSIGNQTNFSIKLTPKAEFDWFKYTVEFPQGVRILKASPEMKVAGNTYAYDALLKAEKSFEFVLGFEYIGNFSITEQVGYRLGALVHNFSKTHSFSVTGDKLLIRAYSDRIENGKGEFYITNPTRSRFDTISVNFTYNNHTFSKELGSIGRGNHKAVSFEYSGPQEELSVKVELGYTTMYGQRLKATKTLTYKYTPPKEVIVEQKEVETTQTQEQTEESPEIKEKRFHLGLFIVGLVMIITIFIGVVILISKLTK